MNGEERPTSALARAYMSPVDARSPSTARARIRLTLTGSVQGVGLRPWIHRTATSLGLAGEVRNAARGVVVELEGEPDGLEAFTRRLREGELPPHARIDHVERAALPPAHAAHFTIAASPDDGPFAPVQADLATCGACLAEVLDPASRRHRYPFTTCSSCGPRFSISRAAPWDRRRTSMAPFAPCAACAAEYADPRDRRFHAQTIACAGCGPTLELLAPAGARVAAGDPALRRAAELLRAGRVLLLHGLGGFQLVCAARDDAAVARVRALKARERKPLALLVADLDQARRLCVVGPVEADLLASARAPIVILPRNDDGEVVSGQVAPGLRTLGVMLPCTPLHHLLARDAGLPLVATSANPSAEPMITDRGEALARYRGRVDGFLAHDREVVRRVDDSVVRVAAGRPLLLRRARGWVPGSLPLEGPPLVAVGGHLKVTVAVADGRRAHVGAHLGDLDSPAALAAHEREVREALAEHALAPAAVACDAHPDYASTRQAARLDLPVVTVQHHEAHVLACAAEHGLAPPFLGLAWDGAGLGSDGTVWGGEAFVVERERVTRVATLRPFRLPGGDKAAREPRRAALGVLHALGLPFEAWPRPAREAFDPAERRVLERLLTTGAHALTTSSVGRLFDALASLCGLCQRASYEAEGAILLEEAALDVGPVDPYPVVLDDAGAPSIVDWGPLALAALADLARGRPTGEIAAAFHEGLAAAVVALARRAGQRTVVLSGGCFQNARLVERSAARLREAGFDPRWPVELPPGDGGLALGQLAGAARRLGRC